MCYAHMIVFKLYHIMYCYSGSYLPIVLCYINVLSDLRIMWSLSCAACDAEKIIQFQVFYCSVIKRKSVYYIFVIPGLSINNSISAFSKARW